MRALTQGVSKLTVPSGSEIVGAVRIARSSAQDRAAASKAVRRLIAAIVALGWGVASARPAVSVDDLPPLPRSDQLEGDALVHAASMTEEDVIVGAAKREQSLGNVASAVTVITADRIRRFGYRTIGEALASVAGTYLVDNRLSYSLGIRGLQAPGDFNTRILVLVDGAAVNESWGAYAGLGFDAIVGIDEVERIELIRGPVSSLYGTNALFGIVNIVTRGASESARAWARAGGHSIQGLVTSGGFAAGRLDRQVRGSIRVNRRPGEDGLALPDGGDIHAGGDDSSSFVGGITAAYGGTFVQLRASRYTRDSPFAPYDAAPAGPPYVQRGRLVMIEGGHARDLSTRLSASGRLYASAYRFSDSAPASAAAPGPAIATVGDTKLVGAELRGRYVIVTDDKLAVTAGVEASYNRTRSTAFDEDTPDTLTVDVPKNFGLVGAYTEVDARPTRWLGLTAGLRADRHSTLDDRVSPRVALFVQRPERYGIKVLYAEGFRNPSAYEAYYEDGDSYVAHPEDLRLERLRSFETVLWARPVSGLSTRLSAFVWSARDLIEQAPAPEDEDLLQFQNVARNVSQGIEAEVSYRTASGWYAFGGGALARVGMRGDAGALEFGDVVNAPALTLSAGVSTPLLFERAHVSTDASLVSSRATRRGDMGAVMPRSPAWLGWNLTIYVPNVRGFDVTVGARNLLGRRDLLPAPGDYDRSEDEKRIVPRVPGEGREVFAQVGYAY